MLPSITQVVKDDIMDLHYEPINQQVLADLAELVVLAMQEVTIKLLVDPSSFSFYVHLLCSRMPWS